MALHLVIVTYKNAAGYSRQKMITGQSKDAAVKKGNKFVAGLEPATIRYAAKVQYMGYSTSGK